MAYAFLDPVFSPLLKMAPVLSILIMALVLSFLITIIYRVMTNQEEMKSMKEELKRHQKEMKELRNDPKKMMEAQKKAMGINSKYMMKSMKPTLVTFIPIILIFGWMNSHIAYEPVIPSAEFTSTVVFKEGSSGDISIIVPESIELLDDSVKDVESSVSWRMQGDAGEYLIQYEYQDRTYDKELLISPDREYKVPVKRVKDSNIRSIAIDHEKVRPFGSISILGWRPGWIGAYIIFSLIFSMSLRKLMKIH